MSETDNIDRTDDEPEREYKVYRNGEFVETKSMTPRMARKLNNLETWDHDEEDFVSYRAEEAV